MPAQGSRGNTLLCFAGSPSRTGKRGRQLPALLFCVLVATLASPASALNGELEYRGDYSRTDSGQASRSSINHVGTLRLRHNTYLWEPWFARLSGSLGLSLTRSRSQSSSQSSRSSSGELTTGDAELGLLPQSRFPLRLWVARDDSRLSSDQLLGPALTNNRTVTRYGLKQKYRRQGGGNYQFRLEETTVEQSSDESRRDERLNWSLSGQESFDEHNLSFNFDRDEVRRSLLGSGGSEESRLNARHRYSPGQSNLTVNNLASMTRRESRRQATQTETNRDQFSTSALWTSGGQRRLRFNSNLRVLETVIGAESEQQLLATNLGIGYRLSEHWRVGTRAGATLRETTRSSQELERESDQVMTQQYDAQIDYDSPSRSFAGFSHRWNTNLNTSYQASEDDTDGTYNASASLGVSQALNRSLAEADFGRLRGQLSQSANYRESSVDEPSSNLNHRLSLTLNRPLVGGNAYGDLQFSDSRQYEDGELERVFQLVNLQLSMQQQPSPNQSLSLSATLQTSRSGDSDDFDDWNPSTNISMSYLQNGVFGVNRLQWRSDLRYTSDNLLFLVQQNDSLEESDDTRWENRLDYSIGLLVTELTATVSESNGSLNQSYRLSVTRRF